MPLIIWFASGKMTTKEARLAIYIGKPDQLFIHQRLHLPETFQDGSMGYRHKIFEIAPGIVVYLDKISSEFFYFACLRCLNSYPGF